LNDPTGDDYSAGASCFKFFDVSDKEIDKRMPYPTALKMWLSSK